MQLRRKIKVLGIAPYEGMRTQMETLAESHPDLQLDAYVGDLRQGVEIVRQNRRKNYDVIISRGGTAELIEQAVKIPVVEITLSVYDVLQAIQLAKNFSGKYAIIGFSSITRPARMLCDLLQYQIDIITLHKEGDVAGALRKARESGCEIILCDTVTQKAARELDMNTVLITSGREGIETALTEAEKVSRNFLNLQEQNLFYQEILNAQESRLVVFDQEGALSFSSLTGPDSEKLMEIIRGELESSRRSRNRNLFKTVGEQMYSISSTQFTIGEEEFVSFSIKAMDIPVSSGRYGIQYYNRQETTDLFFNNIFSSSRTAHDIQNTIDQINESQFAVMILGEPGTGRAQCANLMYRRSRLSDNPLITIDCSLINEKGWKFLTNHFNSPLNGCGNTIHFRELTALGSERMKQLLTILCDANLCARNRVIFSASLREGEHMSQLLREYLNTFSCITFRLPALREHIDDLPNITSFYIGNLNADLNREIVGFDADAMEIMKSYTWPDNYTQLRRVLNELVLMTGTTMISASSVHKVLSREPLYATPSQSAAAAGSAKESGSVSSKGQILVPADATLDQINKRIARTILSQCGGNQAETARRLGIGRTTLWRMLRESGN